MNPKLSVLTTARRGWFTRAVAERMGSDVVVSHQSATVLHGLPTWGLDLTRVHVSKARGRQRSDGIAHVHRSRFEPGEITVVDGLRGVSPARAIAETTCVSSYEVGVVLADAALHQRLVAADALVTTADRHSTGQAEILDRSGRLVGRVDFVLSGRLIVEFDGALKYGDTGDAVLREKWREDRLRECGYRVLRTSWPDLDQPHATADRIRQAVRWL